MPLDMKGDWDQRARAHARYYIATSVADSEEEFDRSGARDVALFFDGLEQLLRPEAVVLDVGCGIGRMDRHVAPRVGHLHGIDVSGEMIRQARVRLAHLPNVTYVEGDGFGLRPIADRSIDLVFSHIVFQHVPRAVARGYFAEVWRVLRPGGAFVFQMPEVGENTPPDPPDTDTFEMRFWREPELRAQLERLGFAWRECRRFAAGAPPVLFDQLRIHVEKPQGG